MIPKAFLIHFNNGRTGYFGMEDLEGCENALCADESITLLYERESAEVAGAFHTPEVTGKYIVNGSTKYRPDYGHAPNSGLQNHSIGDTYPWATQVEGDLNPPIYRAIHLTSDPQRRGPLRSTSREAHEDAAEYARRDSLAAGVHLGGRTWQDIFYAAGLQ